MSGIDAISSLGNSEVNMLLAPTASSLDNTKVAALAIAINSAQSKLTQVTNQLQQIDFSDASQIDSGLTQAVNVLGTFPRAPLNINSMLQASSNRANLSASQVEVLTQMNIEVSHATALATTPLISDETVSAQANSILSGLQSTVNSLAALVFIVPPASTNLNGLTLAAALLAVCNGMANAIEIAVNNFQNQLQQMNAAQQLVQDSVNTVLQLSSMLKLAYNSFVQLAASAGVPPPSDLQVTSSVTDTQNYAFGSSGDTGTGDNFWPSGVIPIQPGSTSSTPPPAPSNFWADASMVTAIGSYALFQSGAAFLNVSDPDTLQYYQANPSPGPVIPPNVNVNEISSVINYIGHTGNFLPQSLAPLSNAITSSPPPVSSGINLCFVAPDPDGPNANLAGALYFSSKLFSLIPASNLTPNLIVSKPSQNLSTNDLSGAGTVAKTVVPSPSPPPSPQPTNYGYVSMPLLSQICQSVLTQAGVFLPTAAYSGQFSSGLGSPTTDPTTGQVTSVNSLSGVAGAISQIPSNLLTTISALQQQATDLVSSVSQLYQAINQLITNNSSGLALG